MATNQNSKKLSTLSKIAAKSIRGSEKRAWLMIEDGKDSFFYIDKIISDPAKFKDPMTCKKILEKLKVEGIDKINAKSPLIAGLVAREGEGFQLSVNVKKNGAGKSTLKKALKDAAVKKIIPNAEIVKMIELSPESEAAKDDAVLDLAIGLESEENSLGKSTAKAVKIFLWWEEEGKSRYNGLAATPTSSDADFLQTAKRRLEKYVKSKMYKLFEPRLFGMIDGPLQKFRFEDFDLTKGKSKAYLDDISNKLEQTQDASAGSMSDQELEDMFVTEVNIIEDMSKLEKLAVQLLLKENDTIDFLDEALSYVSTVEALLAWCSPKDIIRLRDALGNGRWQSFLSFAFLADNQLKDGVNMCKGVKALISRLKKYKEVHPRELLAMCEQSNWDWSESKPFVKERVLEEKGRPKERTHTLTLFEHNNIIGLLAQVPFTPILKEAVSISVVIELEANSPDELEYGLDNPYIAQLVSDAGDFPELISSIKEKFSQICFTHDYYVLDNEDVQQEKLELIRIDLEAVIEQQQNAAADRATRCAAIEFGRAANVKSTRNWQKAGLVFSVVKVGIGALATAAAATATLGAGLIAAHGVAKGIISTAYDFRTFFSNFEQNLGFLQTDVDDIEKRVKLLGTDGGAIASHVWNTFVGEIGEPWKRAGRHADNSALNLSEMKVRAGSMGADLSDLLNISIAFTSKMEILKGNLVNLDNNEMSDLNSNIASLEYHLSKHSDTVQNAVDTAATFGAHVGNCEVRLRTIAEKMKEFEASKGAEVFMNIWSVLEFTGGIIAGAAALGPTVAGGLNPMSDQGWITAANFQAYVVNLDDARGLVKDIHQTIKA